MPIVAVTSGTRGAGKTTVAVNIAAALARLQRRVVLLDTVEGESHVARALGLPQDALPARVPPGVHVLPPSTDGSLIRGLASDSDFVILDIWDVTHEALSLASSAKRIVIVTAGDRTATDRAFGVVRRLAATGTRADVGVVVNAVSRTDDGAHAFRVIESATNHRLGRRLEAYGVVTTDPNIRRAQMMQQPVVNCRPHAPSSRCFEAIARRIAYGGPSDGAGLRRLSLVGFSETLSLPSTRPALEVRKCA